VELEKSKANAESHNVELGTAADHVTSSGDGQPCDLCGTHSIPAAMIQLLFPRTDDHELFK